MIPVSEFLRRIPDSAKEERALIETAFGISVALRGKLDEVRKNDRLSDVGKNEETRRIALGSPLGHLKQIFGRAAAMTADVQNLKLAIKPKAPDRADLYGEQQRAELRAYMRAMPDVERFRMAVEDPAATEAVLHAPSPALTGLSKEQFEQVRDQHLETVFGPQLKGIKAREDMLEVVNTAVDIAGKEFQRESGLNETEMVAALG